MEVVFVKRHSDIPMPKTGPMGDWVDLRAAKSYHIRQGDSGIIKLGVSMKLPSGYGAILVARSSLFKRTGLLQSNAIGVIDNSYCGDDDEWGFPYYATRETRINKGDRICQFMVYPIQPELYFIEVDGLSGENRGGFGSTEVY